MFQAYRLWRLQSKATQLYWGDQYNWEILMCKVIILISIGHLLCKSLLTCKTNLTWKHWRCMGKIYEMSNMITSITIIVKTEHPGDLIVRWNPQVSSVEGHHNWDIPMYKLIIYQRWPDLSQEMYIWCFIIRMHIFVICISIYLISYMNILCNPNKGERGGNHSVGVGAVGRGEWGGGETGTL